MYLSGISFYVLSDHFLVHQNHLYEEAARKHEVCFNYFHFTIVSARPLRSEQRKYNRKIYSDFKEETCLRLVTTLFVAESLLSLKQLPQTTL